MCLLEAVCEDNQVNVLSGSAEYVNEALANPALPSIRLERHGFTHIDTHALRNGHMYAVSRSFSLQPGLRYVGHSGVALLQPAGLHAWSCAVA